MAIGQTICGKCGDKLGHWPEGHIGTFHFGRCDYCGEHDAVTEPRDYGYPQLPKAKEPEQ